MTRRTKRDVETTFVNLKIDYLKKGDTLEGIYKGYYVDKKFGKKRHMLQENPNEITVFPAWVRLDQVITGSKAQKGDNISITYKGSIPGKSGYPTFEFAVAVGEKAPAKRVEEDAEDQPF